MGERPMRVLHVVYGYRPDPVGGTEVYVEGLARQLNAIGCASVVAAPGEVDASYEWEGLPVRRFARAERLSLTQQWRQEDQHAARSFDALLARETPDLVHFHALTAAAGVLAMQAVAARGLPWLFTYHTPTVSCARGALMRWGTQACDGVMRARTCSACAAHGLGLPRAAALALASVPPAWLAWLGARLQPGRVATAMQLPALVRHKLAATRVAWAAADRVVAVSDWVRELLLRNGVASTKLVFSRQGIAAGATAVHSAAWPGAFSAARPLRLGCFSRMDPAKGLDVLVAALERLPGAPLQLVIYAPDGGDQAVRARLQRAAATDPRILLPGALAPDAVPAALAELDLLLVPSVGMETGPLVVYEAFAAGVAVLGSRLGGIAELVRDDTDGLLVAPGSATAWARAIQAALDEPARIARWRGAIQKPRTLTQAAADMLDLYRRCLANHSPLSR